MKFYIWSLLLIASFLAGGCATSPPAEDFDKVWVATQNVLNRHNFIVKPSQYREETIVAVTRVNGDFLSKTRVKVVARIELSEEGYYEPSIRVLNQMDISEPKAFAHPDYQKNHQWINLTANEPMEADLYNEIMEIVEGKRNPYSGKAGRAVTAEYEDHGVEPNSKTIETQGVEFTPETW